MLKRVAAADLLIGMHIHEFCGSWYDHPFWRSAFRIDDLATLRRVRESGVAEVWIDTAKGIDLPGAESEAAVAEEVDAQLAADAIAPHLLERVDSHEEVARAMEICGRAREAIAAMFHEVRMGRALDSAGVMPLIEDIAASVMRNPSVLVTLARLRAMDDYTFMHSVAVSALMIALARQLGLAEDEARQAGLGGLLHDIGKMQVPLDILNKQGFLSDGEFRIVRTHAEAGHGILVKGSGIGDIALEVCLHHHERIDGSGYPHHQAGDQISRFARMAAVCDVYDATTSTRPYKAAWGAADALRKMAEWSRNQYDTTVFHAFVKTVGIYPLGTLVRLRSDRLAVVVDQTGQSLLTPKVKAFYSTTLKKRLVPQIIDLSEPGADDAIVSYEDPAKWDIDDLLFLWSGVGGPSW
jgi:putative nucleotidyltransferase with HDIG domain